MDSSTLTDFVAQTCSIPGRPFRGYVVGGSALVLHGIQKQTKDIDLLFTSDEDRRSFIARAEQQSFACVEDPAAAPTSQGGDRAIMLIGPDTLIVDCFLNRTTHFTACPGLVDRAHPWLSSDDYAVGIVSPADILLLKSATGRPSDAAMALQIMRHITVDWELFHDALSEQYDAGNLRAVFDVMALLEEADAWHLVPESFSKKVLDQMREQLSAITAHSRTRPAVGP